MAGDIPSFTKPYYKPPDKPRQVRIRDTAKAQFRRRASAVPNLIVIRFDCSTAGKQLWFRRRAESTQIQDLLMPRNNSPPNSPWERNHAKIHKYNLCAFCSPSRSTTFESLTCQSRVARQCLSNLIACRTWFKSLIETPCFSRDFVELNSWI